MVKPVIFGIGGQSLSPAEKEFFDIHQPYGFILFARNIADPAQVAQLVQELKDSVQHKFVPILIDQEGGRVCRLKPPLWPIHPPCGDFENTPSPEQAAYVAGQSIAQELERLGINVNCAPLIDVRQKGAHDIIGDRAFSHNQQMVAKLGRAYMQGMKDNNVLAVIKHIPGHGRAMSDSHFDLPVVDAYLDDLREVDFYPFQQLNDAPYAMTAHIIYKAIDPLNCATQSRKVIDLIRNEIGFRGMLMTDDLSMKALTGSFAERTYRSLSAGCDIILHCNGHMDEMAEIAEAI